MSNKPIAYRVCPSCGKMMPVSDKQCACGSTPNHRVFAYHHNFHLWCCVLCVLSALLWAGIWFTSLDLETAQQEVETLEDTVESLDEELSLLQSKYDKLLIDYDHVRDVLKEESKDIVYITEFGNNYHSRPNCSPFASYPIERPIAISFGYSHCPACFDIFGTPKSFITSP